MFDIHSISSTLYMDKIYMDKGHRLSVQHQIRLNPIMNEVVRKEVTKWLDSDIVYPITDSGRVSMFTMYLRREA